MVAKAAAKAPAKVSRLTLVAPAGFGAAVNADYRRLADDLLRCKRLDGVDQVLTTLLARSSTAPGTWSTWRPRTP